MRNIVDLFFSHPLGAVRIRGQEIVWREFNFRSDGWTAEFSMRAAFDGVIIDVSIMAFGVVGPPLPGGPRSTPTATPRGVHLVES